MTDTKAPTLDIDEQIAFMKTGLPAAAISGSAKVVGSMKAILASLERLRDAEKALPEPVAWCVVYEGPPTCGKIHSDPTMYKPTAEAIVKNGAPGLSVASLYPESALLAEVAKRQAAEITQNPCCCVPDSDNGTLAHVCKWHEEMFSDVNKIKRMAETITVENAAKLPVDKLRTFIAHGIRESTLRKKAESELAELRRREDNKKLTNPSKSDKLIYRLKT